MTAIADATDYARDHRAKAKASYYQEHKHVWWQSAWRQRGIVNAAGQPFRIGDYQRLLAAQQGCCGVCLQAQTDVGYTVSYDPRTKVAKALVCNRCRIPMAWALAHREAVLAHLG